MSKHKLVTFATITLLIFLFPIYVYGQSLDAFTRSSPIQVYLSWSFDTTSSSSYNIYRRLSTESIYPSLPLNGSPISPITNCTEFKTIIAEGSEDWLLLANAFADTAINEPLVNVCSIALFPYGSSEWKRATILASVKPKIGIVMGLGFLDNSVISGRSYRYQIRKVSESGTELPFGGTDETTITAGVAGPIETVQNLRIVIGDAMLQLLWNKPSPKYTAFNLYRSTSPSGPYDKRVNNADISADIHLDMDSNIVSPLSNGFIDFSSFDTEGNPIPRLVLGVPVEGPENGKRYYYKVRIKDILGNEGPLSTRIDGKPVDKTPPAVPQGIIVLPDESTSSFQIKWLITKFDIKGRKEKIRDYTVYRYTNPENPNEGATRLVGSIPQPPDPLPTTLEYLSKIDNTSGLRNNCKEETFYYRVEAKDNTGNVSYKSIAVGGALKDTTRPESPKGTTAEGFEDYIKIKWKIKDACDTNIFLIYRALCDFGSWVYCDSTDTTSRQDPREPKDCGGPFVIIGTLTFSEARARSSGDETYFDDHTVPTNSPLCYAYLVKSQDLSQNISGSFPIPDLVNEVIVCQRLRDRTPPEPGIISGLFARDSVIKIEFIGPPVQDIAAYHIYRSSDGEFGTYEWVGGTTIEPPPLTGIPLESRYTPPSNVGCDLIPLVSNEYMSAGTFLDREVEQKKIYWYKALGVDRNGNESSIDSAAGISTFTFASNREVAPEITGIIPDDDSCALTLSWTPEFDPNTMLGFVVFRSDNETGPYFQLANIIKGTSFANNRVLRNKIYWYRIALLKTDGSLTKLSEPKKSFHP